MRANQAEYPVTVMCRLFEVSKSGYYEWLSRPPSRRSREDAELTERIRAIHAASRGTYGAPRIHAELREEGIRVGQKRVARLMRAAGLRGVSRRKGLVTTTRDGSTRGSEDLVERAFDVSQPDELWVADITYVPTATGFIFLAVVLDAFSRRVIGWQMAGHLRTELVLGALDMAVAQRQPEEVIHHSDRGTQYTSIAFGKRCREANVQPSMGRSCFDNALCESFFATLECELIERERFDTKGQARMAVFEFIEGWYNPRRRHTALEFQSPIQYEENYLLTEQAA